MNLKKTFSDHQSSILYLGASVTAQKEGYRPKFHELLECEVGRPVPFYVSALGGVGSLFGVANFKRQAHNFNNVKLVIFEYSTGDLNLWITPKDIINNILKEFFVECSKICKEIIVLHNFRSDFIAGKARLIHDIYNSCALEFGAKVVDLSAKVEDIISINPDWLISHYRDHVHTNLVGSVVVAEMLMEHLVNDLYLDLSGYSILESEVIGLNFYALPDEVLSEGGSYTYPATAQEFNYRSIYSGEDIEYDFRGDIYGVVAIIGPSSGEVVFSVDGKTHHQSFFDRNCFYYRAHCFPLRFSASGFTKLKIAQTHTIPDFALCKGSHPDFSIKREARVCGLIAANFSYGSGD